MHKQIRKIIKVGQTSLAVILPKAWLRYYGLTSKDHVTVFSNDEVIIRAKRERSVEKGGEE